MSAWTRRLADPYPWRARHARYPERRVGNVSLEISMLHARATAVAEVVATRALDTERLGMLSAETVALLIDMGITRMLMPRQWQGLELGLPAVVDVVTALARGCMSVAWCAALYAEHPWILARFDTRAQADVWSAGPDVPLSMSVAAFGTATRVADGFELTGTWPFVSGCDHARWFLLAAAWDAADGSAPPSGLCLVPASDVHIDHASWHVAGLRGTGSKTVTVEGAFVPRHRVRDSRALAVAPPAGPPATPPLFCQPFGGTLGLVLAAVAVGGAEGALEEFRQRITQRVLRHQGRVQALDPAAQMDLADAAMQTRSARLLLEDACDIVRVAGEQSTELGALELAELRVRKAHVVRLCSQAIDRLFGSSGGGALQETSPLQRFWRDVHAIQAHAGLNWSSHAQNYGSLAVGLGPTLNRPW
jgi:alkylation response protein AidB-like acyl-CoA dehydrogenase